MAHDLPEKLNLVLLDGAKALYADILHLVGARLRSGSLVLADDAHRSPEFVSRMCSPMDPTTCPFREPVTWRSRCGCCNFG
jgi:predicted O-methyltransferase YrrM